MNIGQQAMENFQENYARSVSAAVIRRCVDWKLWGAPRQIDCKHTDHTLARLLYVHERTVGDWRRGEQVPNLETTLHIIKIMNDPTLKGWWDGLTALEVEQARYTPVQVQVALLDAARAMTMPLSAPVSHLDRPNLVTALQRAQAAAGAFIRECEG